MIVLKYVMILLVFIISLLIGNIISKKYILRVKELKEIKNAFNIIENKIKFTYETLPEIFTQTSKLVSNNTSSIFMEAARNMKILNAEEAWNKSLETVSTNLHKEDIESIKSFGKMLGKTDKEGQVSQLKLTQTFVEMQIEKAKVEESKNVKMYKSLGIIMGLAFIIILI